MTCRISLLVCAEINQVNGMRVQKITKLIGGADYSFADLYIQWNFIKFDVQIIKLVSPGRARYIVKAISKVCKSSRPTNSRGVRWIELTTREPLYLGMLGI